jgi:predicted nucleotidyltransferase
MEVLSRVTTPLTGREVSRLARAGSEAGTRRALQRLAEQGVVQAEPGGGAIFYRLNRDHLAYPAIEILVGLRRKLLDQLAALFAGWAVRPLHASMFGSTARRDGDTRSDIDILIIRAGGIGEDSEPWTSQVDDLRERVSRWTGNRCQPYQVDPQDLAEHRRAEAGIVQEWIRDAITLYGPGISSFLPGSPREEESFARPGEKIEEGSP